MKQSTLNAELTGLIILIMYWRGCGKMTPGLKTMDLSYFVDQSCMNYVFKVRGIQNKPIYHNFFG